MLRLGCNEIHHHSPGTHRPEAGVSDRGKGLVDLPQGAQQPLGHRLAGQGQVATGIQGDVDVTGREQIRLKSDARTRLIGELRVRSHHADLFPQYARLVEPAQDAAYEGGHSP